MGSETSKNTRSSNENFFQPTSATSKKNTQQPTYQRTRVVNSTQSAYARSAEHSRLQYQQPSTSTSTARIYPALNEQALDVAAFCNSHDYNKQNHQTAARCIPSAPPENIVNTTKTNQRNHNSFVNLTTTTPGNITKKNNLPNNNENLCQSTSATSKKAYQKPVYQKTRDVNSTQRGRPPSTAGDISNDDRLNCPTCKKPYGTRIFQCLTGHSCCQDCKSKSCGLCGRAIDPDKRNFALEDSINKFQVPCDNADSGCKLSIKRIDMEAHLEECPFNVRACPLQLMGVAQCNWKGKLYELKEHFDVVHPNNRTADVGKEMTISNFSVFATLNHRFTYLINLNTFYFILHVSIDSEKVLMAVQFCGTNISASKWYYEVHVYNKQNPRKKYFYTDVCKPYNLPMTEIFSTGAVLPKCFAEGFLDSETLTYKVYIKKQNGNDRGRRNQRGRGRNQNLFNPRTNSVNRNPFDD